MAKIQRKSSSADPSKPKASFLACFGFSKKETKYIGRSDHEHKIKRRWFCGSGFGVKKSATQTVPIDMSSTASDKRGPSNKVHKLSKVNNSLESKSKPKHPLVPATAREIEVVPPPPEKPQPQTSNVLNLQNRRHLDSAKEDTCQKRVSFCRKIDSIRTAGCSEPGSPVKVAVAEEPSSRRTAAVMTQSASFPTPMKRERERRFVWGNINETNSKKKLDPVIGMSIIMVTLIIMIVWGRLCAILCTSAWFYFVPRLISTTNASDHQISNSNSTNIHLDFNSDEYKKKVVLGGFLERNHRIVI